MEEGRLGRIEVSPVAIASIASEAVFSCYGVVGMASKNLVDSLVRVLQREQARKGVEVKLIGNHIAIDVYVVLEYGVRISEVAHNIMHTVRYNVEKTLGMPVGEVNVHVQGLRVSD